MKNRSSKINDKGMGNFGYKKRHTPSMNAIMIKTLLILLTFIPSLAFGQQTKELVDAKKREVYYVLKSNHSIKHGNYKKLNYKGLAIINGFFKNGIKDSIWEFYDYKGELQQKYDFTRNEIIYFKIGDKDKGYKYKVMNGSDTIETMLERPPIYIGADAALFEKTSLTRYPSIATEYGISGTVFISFMIDKNGKTSNHRVSSGIGYGCDEEALRVVKSIPDNWLPGILKGEKVTVEYKMPIKFQLIDE